MLPCGFRDEPLSITLFSLRPFHRVEQYARFSLTIFTYALFPGIDCAACRLRGHAHGELRRFMLLQWVWVVTAEIDDFPVDMAAKSGPCGISSISDNIGEALCAATS